MKRFRFMKVGEVICGKRGKGNDGGLDFYVGRDLYGEDIDCKNELE